MAAEVISNIYVRTYENIIRQLAQQKGSLLRAWTMEKSAPYMHLWDRLGTATVAAKTDGTTTATPENAGALDRRRTTPATYHTGVTLEQEELAKILVDPTSALAESQAMALGRKMDEVILAAALGNALDEAGGTTALPGGQQLGGATQAFDFAFIQSVQEKFMANDISPDEEKVFIIRPNGAKKIAALTQATSSDYVNGKALANGPFVQKWMGFTWIVTNNVGLTNVSGLQYYYVAMTRRAMGFHLAKDVWARVAEDPGQSFAKRVYAAMTIGAARIEDTHVVRAHVLES
jgi:hypothetical protein